MEEVRNDEFVYPVERSELDRLCLEMVREYSCDTVYFKDKNSHFLWNSKQHAAQVGVESAEDMLGKCDFDFFPETFAQAARNIEIEIMRTGMPRVRKTFWQGLFFGIEVPFLQREERDNWHLGDFA